MITKEDELKEKAKEKYNNAVEYNLNQLNEIGDKALCDVDAKSTYFETVNEIDIKITQDGLCGINKIKDMSDSVEEIIKNYTLLRKDMFDVLAWPGYAVSINTLRQSKFKDRVDLLLIDLYKFFEVTNDECELTKEIVKKIWKSCDLARAYVYPNTFYWLRKFETFDKFIKERGLESYLKKENDKLVLWTNDKGFTKEYFKELLKRTERYKEEKGDIKNANDSV